MKASILSVRRGSLFAVMAVLLIAVIAMSGFFTSTVMAYGDSYYMRVTYGTMDTETDIYFGDTTVSPTVETGPIAGWCASEDTYIYIGTKYGYYLFDYYQDYYPGSVTSLPAHVQSVDWNRITYVMNNRTGYDNEQVQNVVWYYTNDRTYGELTAAEKVLADAADTNGGNYDPEDSGGTLKPIIVDVGTSVQMQFYMVECDDPTNPTPEMPPVVLFGIGILGLVGVVWFSKRHSTATICD